MTPMKVASIVNCVSSLGIAVAVLICTTLADQSLAALRDAVPEATFINMQTQMRANFVAAAIAATFGVALAQYAIVITGIRKGWFSPIP